MTSSTKQAPVNTIIQHSSPLAQHQADELKAHQLLAIAYRKMKMTDLQHAARGFEMDWAGLTRKDLLEQVINEAQARWSNEHQAPITPDEMADEVLTTCSHISDPSEYRLFGCEVCAKEDAEWAEEKAAEMAKNREPEAGDEDDGPDDVETCEHGTIIGGERCFDCDPPEKVVPQPELTGEQVEMVKPTVDEEDWFNDGLESFKAKKMTELRELAQAANFTLTAAIKPKMALQLAQVALYRHRLANGKNPETGTPIRPAKGTKGTGKAPKATKTPIPEADRPAKIQELLAQLKTSQVAREKKGIRTQLRSLGHYISKQK